MDGGGRGEIEGRREKNLKNSDERRKRKTTKI